MQTDSRNYVPEDLCTNFQVDLSCLVDHELDEPAAGRAMLHLEACEACRSFFEDTRTQIRLHRDMADPQRLFARIAMLTGEEFVNQAESLHLVHRLATVFYQLGKAYVLAAIDPGYRERVFDDAVAVETAQARGRGFVDGVLLDGKQAVSGLDWQRARSMLNGRLEKIEGPFEKGRRLLEEAISVDPAHEEAQLYIAFLHAHEGRHLQAAAVYRKVFDTAEDEANRGHAIVQLGRLHSSEKNYRKALACWRWVTISGLADSDDRFFFVRFNLGMVYALTGNRGRALHYFRQLLDRHPSRVSAVADLFARSPKLRESIDLQPGFAEALIESCPELFIDSAAHDSQGSGSIEEAS